MADKCSSPITVCCVCAQDNQLIRAGQWWRLITPVALHANLMHLVTNNYSLNSLGPAVEMLSGRPRFLTVYTASAVAGTAASFAFSPASSVGASGDALSSAPLNSTCGAWQCLADTSASCCDMTKLLAVRPVPEVLLVSAMGAL